MNNDFLQNHKLNKQPALISKLDEYDKNALVKFINAMHKNHMMDLLYSITDLSQ